MAVFIPANTATSTLRNWVYNPSFDVQPTAGWKAIGGGTHSVVAGQHRIVWPAGAIIDAGMSLQWPADCTPGQAWYGRVDVGLGVIARRVRVYLAWYAGTTLLSTSTKTYRDLPATGSATVTLAATGTAPAGATKVDLWVGLEVSDAPVAAGQEFYFDQALLATPAPYVYFDGNTRPDDVYRYAWEGTPGYSYSTRTTYSYTEANRSKPALVYERSVSDESPGIVLRPAGATWPTTVYPFPGLTAQTGHLTALYTSLTEVERLRALQRAGDVLYLADDGTATPMHIHRVSAADIYGYQTDKYAVGIEYTRTGA